MNHSLHPGGTLVAVCVTYDMSSPTSMCESVGVIILLRLQLVVYNMVKLVGICYSYNFLCG